MLATEWNICIGKSFDLALAEMNAVISIDA